MQAEFFDNTSGWVPRKLCLPFSENFDEMRSRKKQPAFLEATKRAWTEFQTGKAAPPAGSPEAGTLVAPPATVAAVAR